MKGSRDWYASAPLSKAMTDFFAQPQVANGASELLLEVLGDSGRHARAAVGVNALPLNASVEIEFLFEIE